MGRFDWFSGATGDWQVRARRRLQRLVEEHGAGAQEYVSRRVATTKWGSFRRRRWLFIKKELERSRGGG